MRAAPRSRPRTLPAAALVAALGLLPPPGAAARSRLPDPPVVELVQVAPLAAPGAALPAALRAAWGLLTLPAPWSPGDAAVVLASDGLPGSPLQARLAEAMLGEGAAVLELDAAPEAPPEGQSAEALLPKLFGALALLRVQAGAGPVVVIGLEGAGAAALLAAEERRARGHLPPGMPGFAGGAALGLLGAGFRGGTPQPAAERWELRVPLLCEALAWGVGREAALAREPESPEFMPRCLAGFAPPARDPLAPDHPGRAMLAEGLP